ncbi:MAG: phosphate ABC transporter substrate-binding protein PstS [Gloeomargaritaceae cyanobacterium C42_A2020_066]|nr:phosphate ABC transporter substrate-binding protein PstS [Gloeomargaritaceae cyanobacterium C42_A2020_066]
MLLALPLALVACQPRTPQSVTETPIAPASPTGPSVQLYGAGATFPSFIYLRWFEDYRRQRPNIEISYQPIGSAAGLQQVANETVDFGGSDVAPTADFIAKVPRGLVLIPATAGSVAVVYNLPDIGPGLKLDRRVLPDIFLGKITRWNDPKITALNPDRTLPNLPITLVHRSDGSGTTQVFTAHLSAISPAWQTQVGTGLTVQWPAGVGIKDNAGISAQIQQEPGSIGYVEYAFAKQLNLATAALQNRAGQFVQPTPAATAKGLATIQLSETLAGSVPDPDGADVYPVVTYSWILAYQRYEQPDKAKALREMLQWALTEGQTLGPELGYVPLPPEVAARAVAAAKTIEP